MRILLIRMMGLGDVASIGVPAAKLLRQLHPEAHITFLTFAAGDELMRLVPEVDEVMSIGRVQWPDEIFAALQSFGALAETIAAAGFDQIYNLDTWFMPCFAARLLKDSGASLQGNYISMPVTELLSRLEGGELSPSYVNTPANYLASTFPRMRDWVVPWWQHDERPQRYPDFYLNHCCGLSGSVDISLEVEADRELLEEAGGRPIIALAASGRVASKQYPFAEALGELLTGRGCLVWSRFDGSAPMARTLGRLRASDLIVTVASAPQWLAELAGCPALVISGPLPPAVLGPALAAERTLDCQYCAQSTCPQGIDFRCMQVPPAALAAKVERYLAESRARTP